MPEPRTPQDEPFTARFGWTRWLVWFLVRIGASLLLGVALVLFSDKRTAVVGMVFCIVFGYVLVTVLATGFGRKVAIKVDENGVLLGGVGLRYHKTTTFLPWAQISSVRIWARRPMRIWQQVRFLTVHRTAGLVGVRRPIVAWDCSSAELLEALQRFAPGLPVSVHADVRL